MFEVNIVTISSVFLGVSCFIILKPLSLELWESSVWQTLIRNPCIHFIYSSWGNLVVSKYLFVSVSAELGDTNSKNTLKHWWCFRLFFSQENWGAYCDGFVFKQTKELSDLLWTTLKIFCITVFFVKKQVWLNLFVLFYPI